MSKCREGLNNWFSSEERPRHLTVEEVFKASWNARGKVDAEICNFIQKKSRAWSDVAKNCAEDIEQENEK